MTAARSSARDASGRVPSVEEEDVQRSVRYSLGGPTNSNTQLFECVAAHSLENGE